jgi:dipeptidyl aminopeptidase/acylaminoacyl peptidase
MYGTSDISHTFGELQWGGQPHDSEEWYKAHSPSTYAHRATTPTLIIHGEADERCPIGQGEQMFIALLKAGCEVEFARYPGGAHGFRRNGPPEHREDCWERTLGWFKEHLGEAK